MTRKASIFVVCVLVACGGSMTTVDGNQDTNSLSTTDQNQLCTDTYNFVKNAMSSGDIAKISCGFAGASLDGGDCQTTYNTCLANAQQNQQQLPPTPDCTGFDQAIAKCNTTVSEYTKCLQEEVDAMKSMESQLPFCTQAQEESAALQAYAKISSDCIQLMQTCSITFGPTSGSSSSSSFDGGGGG